MEDGLYFLIEKNNGWAIRSERDGDEKTDYMYFLKDGEVANKISRKSVFWGDPILLAAGDIYDALIIDSEEVKVTQLSSDALVECLKYIKGYKKTKPSIEERQAASDYLTKLVKEHAKGEQSYDIEAKIKEFCALPWNVIDRAYATPSGNVIVYDITLSKRENISSKKDFEKDEVKIMYSEQKKKYMFRVPVFMFSEIYMILGENPLLEQLFKDEKAFLEREIGSKKRTVDLLLSLNSKARSISGGAFYKELSTMMNGLMTMRRDDFFKKFGEYGISLSTKEKYKQLRGFIVV